MYFYLSGKPKKVEHVSRFFITINTNKTGLENIKPLKKRLRRFLSKLG